jgi:hypothetical protein
MWRNREIWASLLMTPGEMWGDVGRYREIWGDIREI